MRSELNRYIGNHNSQDVMSEISDNASLPTGDVSRLADHLFRHEAGKLISVLTGIFAINVCVLPSGTVAGGSNCARPQDPLRVQPCRNRESISNDRSSYCQAIDAGQTKGPR